MNEKIDKDDVFERHKSTGKNYFRHKAILIVDEARDSRELLYKGLSKHLGLVECAESIEKAEKLLHRCHFDLIITEVTFTEKSGIEWIEKVHKTGNKANVIFITSNSNLAESIKALRAGASDFITKPFTIEQIIVAVEHCIERQDIKRKQFIPRRQLDRTSSQTEIIGNSPAILDIHSVIRHVAPRPSTILIEGESGTGKELVARSIHNHSGLTGSFVPVNCGAMAAELLESELFGHVKGAFTGAHQNREGLITFANEGTLFLDEIGEMPLSMQAHLLRVIEDKTIRPIGSNQEIFVNVRIIAATNKELSQAVKAGGFREDLFFRLNVLNLQMPPLRERLDDVELLVRHFIDSISDNLGISSPGIGREELSLLCQYTWPGNIRELRNVLERSILLNKLPSECITGFAGKTTRSTSTGQSLLLADIEKQHILEVLKQENGNKSAAARKLGVSRKTLERKLTTWKMAV